MARKSGRWVAPIALIAVIVAIVLVISGGVGHSHRSAPRHPRHTAATLHVARRPRFYVIQAGDSLSTISHKTGVLVATLEALNPSVDPNALQPGQRLQLRR